MKRNMPICALLFLVSISSCTKTDVGTGGLTVQNYIGTASVQDARGSRLPEIGGTISEGDTVITGSRSSVDLVYNESALIRINENSSVQINSVMSRIKNTMELSMQNGVIFTTLSKLKDDENFQVSTRTLVVAVRGTSFRVSSDDNSSDTDVLSGAVKVNPVQDGRVVSEISSIVGENNRAEIKKDQVRDIVRKRKLAVSPIRAERMKILRDDLKGIDNAVIDRLNPRLRQEFRMNILQMKKEQFEKMENQRQERMREFIEKKKERGARIRERRMEKTEQRRERESLREERRKNEKPAIAKPAPGEKRGLAQKLKDRREEAGKAAPAEKKNIKEKLQERLKERRQQRQQNQEK